MILLLLALLPRVEVEGSVLRIYTREGEFRGQIASERIQSQGELYIFKEPQGLLRVDGLTLVIRASEASYDAARQVLLFEGKVRGHQEDMGIRLESQRILYDLESGEIQSPEVLWVEMRGLRLRGQRFRADWKARTIWLSGGVEGLLAEAT